MLWRVALHFWAFECIPVSLANELSEVSSLILATEGVANLNFSGLGGALVLGLGDVALWNRNGLTSFDVVKRYTHEWFNLTYVKFLHYRSGELRLSNLLA